MGGASNNMMQLVHQIIIMLRSQIRHYHNLSLVWQTMSVNTGEFGYGGI